MDETPDDDNAEAHDPQRLAVKSRGLDTPKKLVAVSLRQAGKSFQAIADALGVDRGTVSRFLRDVVSSEDARRLLELQRGPAVDAWSTAMVEAAKKGNHQPARDLLIATDVIEDEQPKGGGITIIVGDGRTPAGTIPIMPALEMNPATGQFEWVMPKQLEESKLPEHS